MIKLNEVSMPGSAWNRTEDNEPVFILVARDKIAAATVEAWVAFARTHGVNQRKLSEALEVAGAMEAWQASHGSKLPD
jgi:hypothetical protein